MSFEFRVETPPLALPSPALSPTLSSAPSGADRTDNLSISCVIPCLNECDNLHRLLPALRQELKALSTQWEIIVIDDGSTDGTQDLMTEWTLHDGMRYLQLSRNFGKEAALSAGLEASDGEVVICLDADGQHPLALMASMLQRWRAGADMVYAVRMHRDDESWFKRAGSYWFYRLLSGTRGVTIPAHAGDFRLMDRRVVDALVALPERTRFMKGLYAWVGFRGEPLPYTPDARTNGASRYNTWHLIRLALTGLTAFTMWPLRMVSLLGGLFALMSFAYGGYLVLAYLLNGNPISGWTTIVAALLFFAGVNLISLGVVGEYVARIFDEVKGRPLFVVRQQRGRARRPPSAQVRS